MPRRRLSDRITDSFRVLTELDLSHAYERQAGTLALVFLAIVAVGALVISSRMRGPVHTPVVIEFPTSGGLARGDRVLVLGAPVGRVRDVRLLGPGRVQVTASVERPYAPRRDASAQILALDLVGTQAISYDPGVAPDPLPAGVAVAGTAAVTVTQQLASLREQAAEIAVQLRDFDPEVFREDLARTRRALARAQEAVRAVPADSLARQLDGLFDEGRVLVARLDSLQAAFPAAALAAQRESLAANAAVLMEQVGAVQLSLAEVRERLAAGEGNVGRFQRDSTLRVELDGVRTSLRLLQEKLLGRRPPSSP